MFPKLNHLTFACVSTGYGFVFQRLYPKFVENLCGFSQNAELFTVDVYHY